MKTKKREKNNNFLKNKNKILPSRDGNSNLKEVFLGTFAILSIILALTLYFYYKVNSIYEDEISNMKDVHLLKADIKPYKKFNLGISGFIEITEVFEGINIIGKIHGLNPGTTHAVHVLEFSDITQVKNNKVSNEFLKHYNPTNTIHSCPTTNNLDEEKYHSGDFGNIIANHEGIAFISIIRKISIKSLNGRILIITNSPDKCDAIQEFDDDNDIIGFGLLNTFKPIVPSQANFSSDYFLREINSANKKEFETKNKIFSNQSYKLSKEIDTKQIKKVKATIVEKPLIIEKPIVIEKPLITAKTPIIEKSSIKEKLAIIDKPTIIEKPIRTEKPAIILNPPIVEKSTTIEKPEIIEKLPMFEKPDKFNDFNTLISPPKLDQIEVSNPRTKSRMVTPFIVGDPDEINNSDFENNYLKSNNKENSFSITDLDNIRNVINSNQDNFNIPKLQKIETPIIKKKPEELNNKKEVSLFPSLFPEIKPVEIVKEPQSRSNNSPFLNENPTEFFDNLQDYTKPNKKPKISNNNSLFVIPTFDKEKNLGEMINFDDPFISPNTTPKNAPLYKKTIENGPNINSPFILSDDKSNIFEHLNLNNPMINNEETKTTQNKNYHKYKAPVIVENNPNDSLDSLDYDTNDSENFNKQMENLFKEITEKEEKEKEKKNKPIKSSNMKKPNENPISLAQTNSLEDDINFDKDFMKVSPLKYANAEQPPKSDFSFMSMNIEPLVNDLMKNTTSSKYMSNVDVNLLNPYRDIDLSKNKHLPKTDMDKVDKSRESKSSNLENNFFNIPKFSHSLRETPFDPFFNPFTPNFHQIHLPKNKVGDIKIKKQNYPSSFKDMNSLEHFRELIKNETMNGLKQLKESPIEIPGFHHSTIEKHETKLKNNNKIHKVKQAIPLVNFDLPFLNDKRDIINNFKLIKFKQKNANSISDDIMDDIDDDFPKKDIEFRDENKNKISNHFSNLNKQRSESVNKMLENINKNAYIRQLKSQDNNKLFLHNFKDNIEKIDDYKRNHFTEK